MTKTTQLLALLIAVGWAGMATAGQQRPYQASDQQLQNLVIRLDNHRDVFHVSFERAIDRSPIGPRRRRTTSTVPSRRSTRHSMCSAAA